jgi:hypothetical protein
MHIPRGIIGAAICVLLFVVTSAERRDVMARAPDACTLLTTADASTALQAPSAAGHLLVAGSPTDCVWSDDPAVGDTSRRVVVSTHSPMSFSIAKHPAITTIQIEPVAGIGDEAFYQIYPHGQPPFIWARKGNKAISVRIITGAEPAPFTQAQEKAKLIVLAKAVVAKL